MQLPLLQADIELLRNFARLRRCTRVNIVADREFAMPWRDGLTGSGCGDAQAEAIFVHGLGTSPLDLVPLAQAFEEAGVRSVLLSLEGHDGAKPVRPDADVTTWLAQVSHAVEQASARAAKVYLVGFSIGAALALRVASELDVDGVLCISTFVRPRKRVRTKLALRFTLFPPLGSRRPRVSARRTRCELLYASKIPTTVVASAVAEAPVLYVVPRCCKVLFVHSTDDPVADYSAVVELVQRAASRDVCLVSLSALQHYVQFDIPPTALCRLALAHFTPSAERADIDGPLLVENLKKREDEVRHWSNVLSVIFFGFFTLFSTLLKETLTHIIARDDEAPYVLLSYSLLLTTYLSFVFMYLFYLNRTQAYLRTFLDPLQRVAIGWTSYRTNRWAAGRASRQMTRIVVATSATVLPLTMAGTALGYALAVFHGEFFEHAWHNVLLRLIAIFALYFLVQAVATAVKLVRWTNVHLYEMPPVTATSAEFLEALQDVYASTRPGIVRQPEQVAVVASLLAPPMTGQAGPIA